MSKKVKTVIMVATGTKRYIRWADGTRETVTLRWSTRGGDWVVTRRPPSEADRLAFTTAIAKEAKEKKRKPLKGRP